MDRNGYSPSLFTTEPGECYICGSHRETARHEVIFGIASRVLAKRDGLWINVCPECHRRIHANQSDYLYLKETAQRLFEAQRGHDEWMWVYGRNYLEEREWR